MRPAFALALLLSLPGGLLAEERSRLFQPPRRPALPPLKDGAWARNPIDAFVLAGLEAKGLTPSRPAGRLRLLRRVTLDLTGLPPTGAEQEAFLADLSPGAYEKVVDRLLGSPRFGERQAQHWLDLVRYAESDGFKEDAHRPDAHRYRDWVIRAFNAGLPYDRFVQLQLAGDELAPGDADGRIAAGFNRLWPDEYNAANLEQRRQEVLDDTADTAALAFLGLTFGCARCHDHKFDPISQKDYFRFQAFFAGLYPSDLPAADAAAVAKYRQERAAWEGATKAVRDEMEALVGKNRQEMWRGGLEKFTADIKLAVNTPPEKRTPYQWQIARMAMKQADRAADGAAAKLPAEAKKRYQELERQLPPPPKSLPTAMTVTDVGPVAPPTHRLIGGDWHKPAAEVKPGFPEELGRAEVDTSLPPGVVSSGRRAALARWLTRADHPLTARVMANRLWQHHFGVGIVATSSDFGAQGTKPTHPELLDWLAVELADSGWDLKRLHRLMVTSATYRQDSAVDPRHPGLAIDRENDLLWHFRRRRLEGEAIRDALLAVTGELNDRMFGPSARPELPAAFGKSAWKPDAREHDQHRRSVYVLAKRNLRYPLFDAFDYPDMHNSCSRRLSTTTAPQALILLNSELTLGRARRWAQELRSEHGEDVERIAKAAYHRAWGRSATPNEIALAGRFVQRQLAEGVPLEQALVDLCHAVLNTNEFVYVD
ncbi:MAG: DUF1549 and DUF1553 domain-containing protein [Gemmataceae bacterium]